MGARLAQTSGWGLGTGKRARDSRLSDSGSRNHFSNQRFDSGFTGDGLLAKLPTIQRCATAEIRNELAALASETDPQIFFQSLLVLAQRLESRGKFTFAAEIFSLLPKGSIDTTESLLRNFIKTATDPATLAGMTAAASLFQVSRLAASLASRRIRP